MQQPTTDLETAGKMAGLLVALIALVGFGKRLVRWIVRTVVFWAFSSEFRRNEQTAAEVVALHERLDGLEVSVAHNAELLEHIPSLVAGQARIESDVGELRTDIKSVLQQLGQVQGQNTRRPT